MTHKGMLWIATAVLIGSLGVNAPAAAQEPTMQGFTVNAGVFLPSKRSVRRATEDTWISVDLGYKFQTSEPTESGYFYELGVSVGYRGTGDASYIPVHLTLTGYLNEQFFYRASAGVGVPNDFRRFAQNDDAAFSYSFELGYNLSVGTTPIALTVGYAGIQRGDVNGITVGLRFQF